jgi:hypothetical protein
VAVFSTPVFVKLGSANGCQVFRVTKMFNDGKVLLAVLNYYVRIKIPVTAFDVNHSVTDSM